MKYHVSVMFEVDTSEYHGVGDDAQAARDLIHSMLTGEADMPEKHEIKVFRLSEEAAS